MLDICSIEIAKLRLNFNSKKSVTLRIGPRYNSDCISFYLDGNVLTVRSRLLYVLALGITLTVLHSI